MSAAVDPSNVDEHARWDGPRGAFWSQRADRFNEGVRGYHDQLLEAAAITGSDTVLDIGCALHPGGRIALLTWQPTDRNEWITRFRLAVRDSAAWLTQAVR